MTQNMSGANANPVRHVKLTTAQGLLLTGGVLALFAVVTLWTMIANSSSIDGRIEIMRADGAVALEPFGCDADRVTDQLIVPLRDAEPKEGFHLENRAIVLQDTSVRGETTTARPVEGLVVSYRDEQRNVTKMECTDMQNSLTIRTARRSGSRIKGREDRWDGAYEASCKLNGDTLNLKLEMKNCD